MRAREGESVCVRERLPDAHSTRYVRPGEQEWKCDNEMRTMRMTQCRWDDIETIWKTRKRERWTEEREVALEARFNIEQLGKENTRET